VWHRLKYFQSIRAKNRIILNKSMLNKNDQKKKKKLYPMVGVLGCMAERLKEKLLDEDGVDFVVGPDAYREIPGIISRVFNSTDQKEANTQLSFEETYADIKPVRESSTFSAFVSITRGCNNMCSFCIVPFTRGRERSRPFATILEEVKQAYDNGCREIVLLGQNVNGYHDSSKESAVLFPDSSYKIANEQGGGGFKNLWNSRDRQKPGPRFVDLLEAVANISPELRIRFTSPHPKDFPDEVLHLIKEKNNICNSFHLPLQSGSTSNLSRMRRGYSKEAFIELADRLREIIPNVSISTDIIAGFCGESEEEHQDTIDVMKRVNFDQAFMFAYSLREKTHADRSHAMNDDVPEPVKLRRLQEIIDVHRNSLFMKNRLEELGQLRLVLVEGYSTKSTENDPFLTGRTDGNKRVVFKGNSILSNGYLIDSNSGTLWNKNDNNNINNSITYELIEKLNEIDNNLKLPEINTPTDADFATNLHTKYEKSIIDSLAKISKDHKIDYRVLAGKYVLVKITKANGPTLLGVGLSVSSITEFEK
jgi:MiaB/RimO family radical SAM methylthiotransferase